MSLASVRSSIWLGLWLGILPVAMMWFSEQAYLKDAISQNVYFRLLALENNLMFPGMALASLFGLELSFWVPHSQGAVFLGHFFGFLLFNMVAWTTIIVSIRYLFERLRRRNADTTP